MNENLETEIWKDIVNYEGWYQISDCGNIRSVDRYVNTIGNGKAFKTGKILKSCIDKDGYKRIELGKNNYVKKYYIHRLVANAFICFSNDIKLQINHKDGNKLNNKPRNLEWVDSLTNNHHAIKNGLWDVRGEKSPQSKLTNKNVIDIRNDYKSNNITQRVLARKYNVTQAAISHILLRKSWKHIL